MPFPFANLRFLVEKGSAIGDLQVLILRRSGRILRSRRNGPQFLEVLLRYAMQLCVNFEHGSLRDLLVRLENSVFNCRIRTDRQGEYCREFVQLLFSCKPLLLEVFTLPKLQHLFDTALEKKEIVASFIDFLVGILEDLLDSETDSMVREEDRLKFLSPELKLLLIFLGDTPLQRTQLEESNNILTEIEDIANKAGFLLYSFIFTNYRVDLGISFLLPKLEILKAKIKEFCTTVSKLPKFTFPNTSLVSLFIVDSLNHVLNNKADLIVDEKDQLTVLHEELMFSRSFINMIFS